jgi:hypothetical protein
VENPARGEVRSIPKGESGPVEDEDTDRARAGK